MSTENSFDPDSVASRIVAFLASLQGMDDYRPAPATAAIDLMSGTIVRPDVNFPHGDKLKCNLRRLLRMPLCPSIPINW